jgi:RNA polymerase sigma-70 factor (ECF subfamily)
VTEQEAIDALIAGDIGGLELLVRRYQTKAIRAAFLITHNEDVAHDVVQKAFLRVADRIEQYDRQRPFSPWFMRIVVNDALKAVQRGPRWVSLELEKVDFPEKLRSWQPSPEEAITAKQLQETVWQALSQLTPKQRAAVVMRYYLDMGETEMAAQMEVAPGTVKWRLHTARERLRRLLGLEVSG